MDLNKSSDKKVRFGTCSKDCYGSCVFKGVWNDKTPEFKFISAKPLKNHPFTNGFFCIKLNNREKLVYHQLRLKKPLIRNSTKGENIFKVIDLKEALKVIGRKICDITNEFGSNSIVAAFNAGNSGLLSRYAPLRFFGTLGATVTNGGICNEGGCAGLTKLFGTYSTTNPFQLTNSSTKLIVVWGSDLYNRNIHAYHLVKQALKKGKKLVVIDSRKTKIAEDSHCFIYTKPGTDHLLAQLIIKDLIGYQEYDKDFLKNHVDGFEDIIIKVSNINENDISSLLNIEMTQLQKFLDFLIKYKHHTIFNVGYGIQKDFFGGRIVQTLALIQIILGNFGKPGTGLIYYQSDFNKAFISPIFDYITQISPSSKLPVIDLIRLGSELSSQKYKMIFIYNFNPASSLPNQNQVRASLMRKDLYVVVLDLFLNESTKYADIVIPSKFDVETDDLFTPYYIPGLSINQAGPCPYPDCLSNFEFFQRLACEIGWSNNPIFQEQDNLIIQECFKLLPPNIQQSITHQGFYLYLNNKNVPFNSLDFPTNNGKINLSNFDFNFGKDDLKFRLKNKDNEFYLISPSYRYFIHSQFGELHVKNLEVFNKIFLCSYDINNLGLIIGDQVLVSNNYGTAKYFVEINNSLEPKVALIYSGSPRASLNSPNVNIFTPDQPEELGLSGAYNSAKIRISKI